MCYIIHFTPSELATLDLIIDSLNEEDKDSLTEKLSLAIGLQAELGVVVRLENKELRRLGELLMDAYLLRDYNDTGISYMQILKNALIEIADNVWRESDIEIG